MGEILVGTCSWADRTLIDSGWYPKGASTPEKRLAYYAERYPVVEVDATYYALPVERNAVLWVERTPVHFTFHVKAYSLLTGHPTRVAAMPKHLRDAAGAKARVYAKDLPGKAREEIWEMFRAALMPLHSAGKLGYVLFQFPEWFVPSRDNKDEILRCAERLPDYRVAVEFRRGSWLSPERNARMTLDFLAKNDIPFVGVDMPQGFPSSLPPILEATAKDLSVVRLHGHNDENWTKKGLSAAERFDYSYSQEELEGLAPRLLELSRSARRTHVMFNNCYRDKAVNNAAQMASLLADVI